MCLRVLKESDKSRFDSYSVRNSVFSYPILPSGIVTCTFSTITFQIAVKSALKQAVVLMKIRILDFFCVQVDGLITEGWGWVL